MIEQPFLENLAHISIGRQRTIHHILKPRTSERDWFWKLGEVVDLFGTVHLNTFESLSRQKDPYLMYCWKQCIGL